MFHSKPTSGDSSEDNRAQGLRLNLGGDHSPPKHPASNQSESGGQQSLQETIDQGLEAARADTHANIPESVFARNGLTKELGSHETKDLSSTEGSIPDSKWGSYAITGDFSASAASAGAQLTARPSLRRTLRSGHGNVFDETTPQRIGKYEIKGVLGRGGMGIVYLARQIGLERDVALKMVLAGSQATGSQLARFQAEAKAVAQLKHPCIVQVFEVDEHQGLPYFSLEFVEGMSLDQRLDGKPLTPRDAAEMTEKICRAMQYAHDRGILHRDLKPANILVTEDGQPKVTDFGLAKQLDDQDSLSTKAGTIMGTPSYMSPEQAQGMIDQLTPASDQYSIGALLYELLTGRPPFLGTKAFDTISQVVHKEPVPPIQLQEALPADIDTICLKALQKLPEKRYASCSDMADDLVRFLQDQPIIARPISLWERSWRWCRRNPLVAIPSALAAALLIVTAAVSTWSYLATAAQAAIIAQERDNSNRQRDEANKQRDEADKQRGLALENAEKARAAKDEAERQRVLAEEAKLQAEKNQKLAESQTMLALKNMQMVVSEFDDRLKQQPGMNETRIALLSYLDKKWDELDLSLAGGIQGEAIPTQMAVRSKLAQAFSSLGQLDSAVKQHDFLYAAAHERLLVKDRSDASRSNLAKVCMTIESNLSRMDFDFDRSAKYLDEAKELLYEIRRIPKPQPGSPPPAAICETLQQVLIASGNNRYKIGAIPGAIEDYQQLMKEAQKNIEPPEQAEVWFSGFPPEVRKRLSLQSQQNVELAKSAISKTLSWQGKIDDAVAQFESGIEKNRQLLASLPESSTPLDRRNATDQVAMQLSNLGRLLLRFERAEPAMKALSESVQLRAGNYQSDATDAYNKKEYAACLHYAGVAHDLLNQPKQALVHFERARGLREEIAKLSGSVSSKVDLMLTQARLGNESETLKWIDQLSQNTGKNHDLWLDIARSYSQLVRRGADNKRDRYRQAAIEALRRVVQDGLLHPFPLEREPDLVPIRSEPAYLEIVKQLTDKSQSS